MEKLDLTQIIIGLLKFDGIYSDELKSETIVLWSELLRIVKLDPTAWREAKSAFMHNYSLNTSNRQIEKNYDTIKFIFERYGRRSITGNTLVRMVSVCELTFEQVAKIKKEDHSLPPAFDENLRFQETSESKTLRYELENCIINRQCSDINRILDIGRECFSKMLEEENADVYILKNGSTTRFQDLGVNLDDIMASIYKPDNIELDSRFGKLMRFLNMSNRYTDDDGYLYLQMKIGNVEQGDHMNIPDKDGKIREVYRLFPWIQIISKALHYRLDKIAQRIEGNYTYNHRGWIKKLLDEGWVKNKIIISTDMTKYSDTLDRNFLLLILANMGIPKKILDEIDDLYSLPIADNLKRSIYSGTKATYQGQYGDFPLITIANLILQCFVYYKTRQIKRIGYCAAVGDDTGMVFDYGDPNILMNSIVQVYGCVGVNINKSKTHILNNGTGIIDFVKLEVDQYGIIPFINPRSIVNNDIDSVVRDVYNLNLDNNIDIRDLLCDLFGKSEGKNLYELSVINGGISYHQLTKRDVLLYQMRLLQLSKLLGRDIDNLRIWLQNLKNLLSNNYDEIGDKLRLRDTALIGWLNTEDIIECQNRDINIDDMIEMKMLNCQETGLKGNEYKIIDELLDKEPLVMKEQYNKSDLDKTKDKYLAGLWENIIDYETQAAYRKQKEAKRKRKISVYLPLMNNVLIDSEFNLRTSIFYQKDYPKTIREYEELRTFRIKVNNAKKLHELIISSIYTYSQCSYGNWYYYNDYEGIKYRYYQVHTNTKYTIMPEIVWLKWCKEKLQENVDYQSYLDSLEYWDK